VVSRPVEVNAQEADYMMSKPTVFLGMSGGVDSSVAALLLTEQGYDVKGVTLQVWEPEDENTPVTKKWEERGCCKVGLARHVAQRLGIPHEVVDTRETFRKNVVDDFIAGYLSGTTPNPCVRCNERVKFGRLYELAKARGADFVATGHYARVLPVDEGVGLFRGADGKKDQSYFLYRLPAAWLPQILFPVGHLQKTEVWKRAEELDLPADEMKESQEICFVTQGDYRTFLTAEAPQALRPGPFLDPEGKTIGEHRGIAFYTPGQRKGLGIASGERLYVKEVNPETNAVVLGRAEDLSRQTCTVHDINWLGDALPETLDHVDIKYRYASPAVAGRVQQHTAGTFSIEFQEPQQALSPGQSLVLYQGDHVLGGGIIQQFERRHIQQPIETTSRSAT
jgi:tRNA-specific 2-thiouridylase